MAKDVVDRRILAHSERERGQLQYVLTSRIVLEQVKGILAERWNTSVDDAFNALRTYARSHSYQLASLAREIAASRRSAAVRTDHGLGAVPAHHSRE
ncbi:ANTAR domain-containing protein [Streptomyces sp. RKAG293]|uniref:ANTAR domain-containing protein n=1 Tax=Streptomyces sp. RKAG293 TaxID=2893403 RepID=UPI002033904B|nr:ANTAR domain-containing protein [Streptomyces sp. RKAG293]MCM2419116.1 ANTAR domain-containing protein [Streptomyces sp. RKAG293]